MDKIWISQKEVELSKQLMEQEEEDFYKQMWKKQFTILIKNDEGEYGRKHRLLISDGYLWFDTADGEYNIGKIKLSELKEKIEEYEKEL